MTPEEATAGGKKDWILVVEDEEDLAKLLVSRLTKEGYKVLSSRKLSEAVKLISNQKFSCIVLDLRLDQGSGEKIIDVVRQEKNGFNYMTPILVMSGHLDVDIVKRIKDRVQAILAKPFESEAFVTKVSQLCGTASS